MGVDFYHLMLLNKIVPGVLKRVPIAENFTLSNEPGKKLKKIQFKTGFFEIYSLNMQDNGTHLGADVIFSIVPLTKTGAANVTADKASARMLYFEYYGNQIGQFRCDRYDPENGVYTVTADFMGGQLPIFENYEVRIKYPDITEVGDSTAEANYGQPVQCTLEGYSYEIDFDKALEAEISLMAMAIEKALAEKMHVLRGV